MSTCASASDSNTDYGSDAWNDVMLVRIERCLRSVHSTCQAIQKHNTERSSCVRHRSTCNYRTRRVAHVPGCRWRSVTCLAVSRPCLCSEGPPKGTTTDSSCVTGSPDPSRGRTIEYSPDPNPSSSRLLPTCLNASLPIATRPSAACRWASRSSSSGATLDLDRCMIHRYLIPAHRGTLTIL